MNAPSMRPALVPLIAGLLMTGTVATVSVAPSSMSLLDAGDATVVNSNQLIVDSQQLTYTGTNVSGAVVVVNNTGESSLSGEVTVALKAANGSVVTQQTNSGVVFSSNTTTVTVSFSAPIHPESFFWFGVTVTRTL